jgi:hypothetical protein
MDSRSLRKYVILLVLIMTPVMMAMGAANGTPGKIPIPAKKFNVLFVDQMDVGTEVRDASIEGETLIEGKKGEGTFTIAFDKISSVSFLAKEGRLDAVISLRDGNTLQLTVPKNKKAYGRTPYGTFQISLGDLKKMTVTGTVK